MKKFIISLTLMLSLISIISVSSGPINTSIQTLDHGIN